MRVPVAMARAAGRRWTAVWAAVLALAGILSPAMPAGADMNVSRELECLALTIYFEARGEPDQGKLAVGHVVMNRAAHSLFPRKVCQVVQQGGEKLRYPTTGWARPCRAKDPPATARTDPRRTRRNRPERRERRTSP